LDEMEPTIICLAILGIKIMNKHIEVNKCTTIQQIKKASKVVQIFKNWIEINIGKRSLPKWWLYCQTPWYI